MGPIKLEILNKVGFSQNIRAFWHFYNTYMFKFNVFWGAKMHTFAIVMRIVLNNLKRHI